MELELQYRDACHRMLASIDLRATMHETAAEVSRLHQQLATEGGRILSDAGDEVALRQYRGMVEALVEKLDERERIRARDVFKDALQELLQLGEELGYAQRAEAAAAARAKPAAAALGGLSAVERELAQLENQLASIQTATSVR
jgi:uncharacterized protein YecA (UPF0149 family)